MTFIFRRIHFYCLFLLIYLFFQIYILSCLNSFSGNTSINSPHVFEIYKNLCTKLNREANTDATAQYKVLHLNLFERNISHFDITLVSQCSYNYIHMIDRLSTTWEGPVSVAVFTEVETVEKTLWDLSRILHCKKSENLQLHLVLPVQDIYIKNYNYGLNVIQDSDREVSCHFPDESKIQKNYKGSSPYPINLLRNIAKSGSLTDYIFVIDIDMIPNLNLRMNFLNFANSSASKLNEKSVFVVPAFEIEESISVPKSKAELIRQIKEKKCRPFYFVPCRNCQKATAYNKWLSADEASGSKILYDVKWKHPWEPFFIGKANLPNFDERFKQYGLNRVSQICELHVAGYRFYVLDNAFLVHRGFKTPGDFHETKNEEMDTNRRVYGQFKRELKFKYPNSRETC